jgi:hypothetical protein
MIRVFLDTTTETNLDWDVNWPKSFSGPNSSLQKTLARLIAGNRLELLREWEVKTCHP